VADPGAHLGVERDSRRQQPPVQPASLRRQAKPLDATVVTVDLAANEPQLLGTVDVVGDCRAVDVLAAREQRLRGDALVADRVQDDPDAERAACARERRVDRLADVLGGDHELATEWTESLTRNAWSINNLTS